VREGEGDVTQWAERKGVKKAGEKKDHSSKREEE